jgi:hypothetical protein
LGKRLLNAANDEKAPLPSFDDKGACLVIDGASVHENVLLCVFIRNILVVFLCYLLIFFVKLMRGFSWVKEICVMNEDGDCKQEHTQIRRNGQISC